MNKKEVNSIKGLKIIPLETYVDDRGFLTEIIRSNDHHFNKFGQVYTVTDYSRGTVRAFHKHKKLWDFFFIVNGTAKFAFYDDRRTSSTYKKILIVVTGAKNPSLIVVPPGIFHGWMALEDNTILVSIASEVYNHHHPDETRVPYDSFGFDWSIKFK